MLTRNVNVFMRNVILVMAAALAVTSCGEGEKSTKVRKKVKTEILSDDSSDNLISFPARVISDDKYNLSFKVSGRIMSTRVSEGQKVNKGQLIAELDPRDYRIALDAVQAEYNSVKAEADRVIALYGDSATSPANYDKAVYGLQQITAKLDHARDQLGETRIYSPVSGTVKTIYRLGGEVVGPGTPVAEIVDDSNRLVEIKIPAADYVHRDSFAGCFCRFDVYPDRIFELEPYSFSSVANANQLYTVKLRFAPGQKPLPSVGMTTSVEIKIGGNGNGGSLVKLPTTALGAAGDDAFVYVVSADSVLQRVGVEVISLSGDGSAVVRSSVPLSGREAVTAGVGRLHDGEKVSPIKKMSVSNVGGLL